MSSSRPFSSNPNGFRASDTPTGRCSSTAALSPSSATWGPAAFSRLLDLIEPTFLPPSTGPAADHGGFYFDGPNNSTTNSAGIDIDVKKRMSKLSTEAWELISKYDVGRLEFLVRLAAQLQPLSTSPLLISDSRSEFKTVDVRGDTVRIHLVRVGGRVYISHLSDPDEDATKKHDRNTLLYRDYWFGDSKFLAVKTDSIGVVDIALDESGGRSNWIFHHPTAPFQKQISRVRNADLHTLRLVCDVSYSYNPVHTYTLLTNLPVDEMSSHTAHQQNWCCALLRRRQ